MGTVIIATLQRGKGGTSPFPVTVQADDKRPHVIEVDQTAREAIEEFRRMPYMTCFQIDNQVTYRLGVDVTIGGQVWTPEGASSDFQLKSEKNQPSGYVGLNVDGFVDPQYIRSIYASDFFVVDDEAARFALIALTGDIAHQIDNNNVYIKKNNNTPPTIAGDWADITVAATVSSVNGQVGAVVIDIDGLLAYGTNQAEFDAAVAAAPAVGQLDSQVATNTADIIDIYNLITGLSGEVAIIELYDSGAQYAVDNVVIYDPGTDRVNLYRCTVTPAIGTAPTNTGFWEIVGDFFTQDEITALLAGKGDASVVELNTTHSGSDGSDHSKVTDNETAIDLNTTHKSSDGTDHANVGLNDAHRAGDGSGHADVATNSAARHAQSHNIVSHNDTDATGPELDELTGGGDTALHSHAEGGGHIIEDEGTPVTQRGVMNFKGGGVEVTDEGGKTVVTVARNTEPSTWYVHSAPKGNNANVGSDKFPFETIQAAHDAASDYDTIIIQNANFSQPSSPATSITKRGLVIRSDTTYWNSQPKLQGDWTIDAADILFVNMTPHLTFKKGGSIAYPVVRMNNCGANFNTEAARVFVFTLNTCQMYNDNPINVRSMNIYNSEFESDINAGRAVNIFESHNWGGDIVTGIDGASTVYVIDSFLIGNISITGSLKKYNSVIIGTEDVSESTTIESQGHTIQDNGSPKTKRSNLNIIGATVEDDSGNDATKITVIGEVEQSLTVIDANATDALALDTNASKIIITLDAALTEDWVPSAITGAVQNRIYKFIIYKESENGIDLLLTTNVEFPESSDGDPANGIDPFGANLLNVVVDESAEIEVRGKASSKLLFNQLVY